MPRTVLCGQKQLPKTDLILDFIEIAAKESVIISAHHSQRSCPTASKTNTTTTSHNNIMYLCNPLKFASVSVGISAFVLMQDRLSPSYLRDVKTEASTGCRTCLRITELVNGRTMTGIREITV